MRQKIKNIKIKLPTENGTTLIETAVALLIVSSLIFIVNFYVERYFSNLELRSFGQELMQFSSSCQQYALDQNYQLSQNPTLLKKGTLIIPVENLIEKENLPKFFQKNNLFNCLVHPEIKKNTLLGFEVLSVFKPPHDLPSTKIMQLSDSLGNDVGYYVPSKPNLIKSSEKSWSLQPKKWLENTPTDTKTQLSNILKQGKLFVFVHVSDTRAKPQLTNFNVTFYLNHILSNNILIPFTISPSNADDPNYMLFQWTGKNLTTVKITIKTDSNEMQNQIIIIPTKDLEDTNSYKWVPPSSWSKLNKFNIKITITPYGANDSIGPDYIFNQQITM